MKQKTKVVYFLMNNDEVVYVGQTSDLKRRLAFHKLKNFDSYSFVNVAESECYSTEDYYIELYNPLYNRSLNKGGAYASAQEYFTDRGIDPLEAVMAMHNHAGAKPLFLDNYRLTDLESFDKSCIGGFNQ